MVNESCTSSTSTSAGRTPAFGRDDNELLLVDAAGERALPAADKLTLARELVREIAQRLPSP